MAEPMAIKNMAGMLRSSQLFLGGDFIFMLAIPISAKTRRITVQAPKDNFSCIDGGQ